MDHPFKKISTSIEGCYEIQPRIYLDDRGKFVKIFHKELFFELGLMTHFVEEYYSLSKNWSSNNLQLNKSSKTYHKLITCIKGEMLAIVIDFRKSSPTFKSVFSLELNSSNGNLIYIPKGLTPKFYLFNRDCLFLSMNFRDSKPESDIKTIDNFEFIAPQNEVKYKD